MARISVQTLELEDRDRTFLERTDVNDEVILGGKIDDGGQDMSNFRGSFSFRTWRGRAALTDSDEG